MCRVFKISQVWNLLFQGENELSLSQKVYKMLGKGVVRLHKIMIPIYRYLSHASHGLILSIRSMPPSESLETLK